jgi:hypothetical protein
MKTKFSLLMIIAVMAIMANGCKKSESAAPVTDPRDAFVGSYTEVLNGSFTVTINGQAQTSPINETGSFSIEKGSSENRIVRVETDKTRNEGTISGNHVQFDPMHINGTQSGMTLTYIANVGGNLSGNILNYTMNMTGTVYYQGASFPMTGIITAVATKH